MTEYGRIHTDGSRSGGQPALKPCPFCGSLPKSGDSTYGYWLIFCSDENNCLAQPSVELKTEAQAIAAWNTRQPTQSDALLDAEGVKLYWYRQGKDDGVEHERARIVAWLRDGFVRDWGQLWRNQLINAIEAGEHLK